MPLPLAPYRDTDQGKIAHVSINCIRKQRQLFAIKPIVLTHANNFQPMNRTIDHHRDWVFDVHAHYPFGGVYLCAFFFYAQFKTFKINTGNKTVLVLLLLLVASKLERERERER